MATSLNRGRRGRSHMVPVGDEHYLIGRVDNWAISVRGKPERRRPCDYSYVALLQIHGGEEEQSSIVLIVILTTHIVRVGI